MYIYIHTYTYIYIYIYQFNNSLNEHFFFTRTLQYTQVYRKTILVNLNPLSAIVSYP